MMHSLEHLHFVVDHLFVASNILLQNNLDGAFASWAVSLPHDAIGTSTECFAEAIVRSVSVGQTVREDD